MSIKYFSLLYPLSILLFLVGLSAVAGGIALIATKGLGMPTSWLLPVFRSYLGPGLILACVVGGTYLYASLLLWRRSRNAPYSTAIAGFGMLIWIFAELYILHQQHWFQILYFCIGIGTTVSAMLLLRYNKATITEVNV